MKLSKTSWRILTAGIIIVAFASLGIARAQQINEQEQLSGELSVVEVRLDNLQLRQLSSQQDNLEKQLEQAISQLEAAKDNLRQSIESIEITDSFFEIADTCGVEVIELHSSGPASDELAGIACSVLPLTAKVEGDVPDLISFVTKLNNDFTAGIVKSVDIGTPETSENMSSASIQMIIYAYEGE